MNRPALTDLCLRRRADDTVYRFVPAGPAYGYPAYRRSDDIALWCRRLPDFGWAICTEADYVLARPFSDPGWGELPPEGMWVSAKGDRAYVYDLIVSGDDTGARRARFGES
ncbi:hypothetical protein A5753_15450 [Mycobacterium sp. 852002-51971_SCH5477799-a]|uniref:hypothetical protein n=1 Tax=Mycobacterium sp. 852002-51971_SCH5477799-a TaxID=1834106 RepID=UPI0007FDBFC2|nr:hypothetical protein [Mycobacterium sp. 852002-51971_SCH5477799-a]OBF62286.1 hypothetical protein A5753_15450 [Mycobacterium sp. 852002-51971_SCH5477799-a]